MNEIRLLFRKDIFILINNIKLILRNPLRLLPYAGIAGYIFFMYYLRLKNRDEDESAQEMPALDINGIPEVNFAMQNIVGGVTILALVILIYQLFRATKNNVSFFKMADVNLLFTAPVKPENILIYYMGRSILPSLGGAIIFVAYASSQAIDTFDLTVANFVFLTLAFALFFFIVSPIKFLVYTLNSKYDVMEYIRTGVIVLAVLLSGMIIIPGLLAEKFWQGMFAWITSPWFDFFPIVGWSRGIASYLSHDNLILSIGFIFLYGISYFVILKLVIRFAGYYYEDVLEATKSNEEKLEKVKGKKHVEESSYSLNSKKKLALPDFGTGAKAFYWRNYVHSSRQDFHPLFGLYSLIMVGVGVVLSVLSIFEWFSHYFLYGYLLIMLFIYFFAGIGRANVGDLKKPFFILVPASWPSKFWNMIKLDILQIGLFCLALIIPSVLIAGLNLYIIPLFLFATLEVYLIGFGINIIPQIALDEGWDRKLIKPFMIGGIILFGFVPAFAFSIVAFIVSKQFVWALFGGTFGMFFVAAILMHVTLDVLKRLEFKEM
ncbi:putative ABC exporter domain-containing protein [Algoriphagus sp. D3-2-R+10]|uniref:putative ABC exporter domain-containing protein n=1 Tax=Algoriphagus aurantiacus TaxID=3103948 RepID=UPI002B3BE0DB|nr:putative ABC exporter domain-containing protein [Algoriphagus sp. D3-2-R+10]MEB2776461.1 putative ABC exporter domain-containing protein [Algoriphagus sp. D3-2-R+10]